jgi:anti-sigma B factor antagonist/stage II sporulation protein AA (anti-sigma F factor antagonist)
MSFGEAVFGGAVVVTPTVRVDLNNADAFRDALTTAVAGASTAVIADMSKVDYISSQGLRALMIALRAAKAAGRGFGVAALKPLVLEVFTISRFHLVLSLFPGVRDALEALSPDGLGQFDAS